MAEAYSVFAPFYRFADSEGFLDHFRATPGGRGLRCHYEDMMFVVEHQRDETVQVKAAFNEILDQYIQEEETKDLNNALEICNITRMPETNAFLGDEEQLYQQLQPETNSVSQGYDPLHISSPLGNLLFDHENVIEVWDTGRPEAQLNVIFDFSIRQAIDDLTQCRIEIRKSEIVVKGDSKSDVKKALQKLLVLERAYTQRQEHLTTFDFFILEKEINCRFVFRSPRYMIDHFLLKNFPKFTVEFAELSASRWDSSVKDFIAIRRSPTIIESTRPNCRLWHGYQWPGYGSDGNHPDNWFDYDLKASGERLVSTKTNILTSWVDQVHMRPADPFTGIAPTVGNECSDGRVKKDYIKTNRVAKINRQGNADLTEKLSNTSGGHSHISAKLGPLIRPLVIAGEVAVRPDPVFKVAMPPNFKDHGPLLDLRPEIPGQTHAQQQARISKPRIKHPRPWGQENRNRIGQPTRGKSSLQEMVHSSTDVKWQVTNCAPREVEVQARQTISKESPGDTTKRLDQQDMIVAAKAKIRPANLVQPPVDPELLIDFSERIQITEELINQKYENFTNLKISAGSSEAISDVDTHIVQAAASILDVARSSHGSKVTLELVIGRIYTDRETIAEEHSRQAFAPSDWARTFQTEPRTGGASTEFSSLLSTSWVDTEFILGLKLPRNIHLFNEDPIERNIIYRICCFDRKLQTQTVLDVDDQGRHSIHNPSQMIGAVNIHFPQRVWDSSLVVYESLNINVTPEHPLKAILDSLWIGNTADSATPMLYSRVNPTDLEISVLLRRKTTHQTTDQDIYLQLTEVQALRPSWRSPQAFCCSSATAEAMLEEGRIWWEASLTSKKINQILEENENLELGEVSTWQTSGVVRLGGLNDMIDMAKKIVPRINDVGAGSTTYSVAHGTVAHSSAAPNRTQQSGQPSGFHWGW